MPMWTWNYHSILIGPTLVRTENIFIKTAFKNDFDFVVTQPIWPILIKDARQRFFFFTALRRLATYAVSNAVRKSPVPHRDFFSKFGKVPSTGHTHRGEIHIDKSQNPPPDYIWKVRLKGFFHVFLLKTRLKQVLCVCLQDQDFPKNNL